MGKLTKLIAIPGFMQDEAAWDNLSDFVDEIFVARPATEQAASFDALCQELHKRVASNTDNQDRPALLGYSFGGRLALEYALRHADALGALIIESASFGPATEEERAAAAERNEAWARRIESESIEEVVQWWEALLIFADQQSLPTEAQEAQRAMRLRQDPQMLASLLRGAGVQQMQPQATHFEHLVACAQNCTPVHFIFGSDDAKYAALAAQLPKQIQCHEIKGGHNVHLGAPSEYRRILAGIMGA